MLARMALTELELTSLPTIYKRVMIKSIIHTRPGRSFLADPSSCLTRQACMSQQALLHAAISFNGVALKRTAWWFRLHNIHNIVHNIVPKQCSHKYDILLPFPN
jgi:hypothetical protein